MLAEGRGAGDAHDEPDDDRAVGGAAASYDIRVNLATDPVGATHAFDTENKLTSASRGVTLSYDPPGCSKVLSYM